jgi:hypothetical protein
VTSGAVIAFSAHEWYCFRMFSKRMILAWLFFDEEAVRPLMSQREAPWALPSASSKYSHALFICLCCLCLFVASCADSSSALFDPASPLLAQKLGISEEDWREVHVLISKRQDYSLTYLERSSLGHIGAWMSTKTIDYLQKRGPVFFYAKHQGHWYELDEMSEWGDDK